MAIEERRIEEMGLAAFLIEGEPRAGDAVESGGEGEGVIVPWFLPGVEGGFAEFAIGLGHQGAAAGHGNGLGVPVGKVISNSILPVRMS
jgi:hypothetical protein